MNEEELEKYIENLAAGAVRSEKNALMTQEVQKEKLKEEFRRSFDTTTTREIVREAADLIFKNPDLSTSVKELVFLDFKNVDAVSDATINVIETLASELYSKEDISSAFTLYSFLTFIGGTSDHYQKLGIAALEQQKFPIAISAFTTALDLKPDSIEGWILLAESYLADENHKKALECCEKAESFLSTSPDKEIYEEIITALKSTLSQ